MKKIVFLAILTHFGQPKIALYSVHWILRSSSLKMDVSYTFGMHESEYATSCFQLVHRFLWRYQRPQKFDAKKNEFSHAILTHPRIIHTNLQPLFFCYKFKQASAIQSKTASIVLNRKHCLSSTTSSKIPPNHNYTTVRVRSKLLV